MNLNLNLKNNKELIKIAKQHWPTRPTFLTQKAGHACMANEFLSIIKKN
jgi:hypothetical protein